MNLYLTAIAHILFSVLLFKAINIAKEKDFKVILFFSRIFMFVIVFFYRNIAEITGDNYINIVVITSFLFIALMNFISYFKKIIDHTLLQD